MQKLQAGIHQFQASYFAKNKRLFEELAEQGQRPEALFITCSDSRVVPNLITSAAPGDLFIVRNVGNIVPSPGRGAAGGVSAAIEFGIEVLSIPHVIVCGHTSCGAIDALLHPDRVAHLRFVSRWLRESAALPGIMKERYADLEPDALRTAAVQENVLLQLENLRTFDFVARRLEEGTLTMSGWVFKIATGQVFDFDPVSGQFLQLAAADEEAPRSILTARATPSPPAASGK